MSNLSQRMKFEDCRSLGFAAIGAMYTSIGTGLDFPARQIMVQNLTDVTLAFSTDGLTDKFKLPQFSGYVSDITANKTAQTPTFCMSEGERLYVRQNTVAPTKGEVCFSAIYGADS